MELTGWTKLQVEESGRTLRLAGSVVPPVKMWAVFSDGEGGIMSEQVLWLNLYAVLTGGREDFTIAVPVTSPDGMSLEEHDGYHGDLLGISVGKAPRDEEWLPRSAAKATAPSVS